jgi:hypothetical protein
MLNLRMTVKVNMNYMIKILSFYTEGSNCSVVINQSTAKFDTILIITFHHNTENVLRITVLLFLSCSCILNEEI